MGLPDTLNHKNVIVEVKSGHIQRFVQHYSCDLSVQVQEIIGEMRVFQSSTNGLWPRSTSRYSPRRRTAHLCSSRMATRTSEASSSMPLPAAPLPRMLSRSSPFSSPTRPMAL